MISLVQIQVHRCHTGNTVRLEGYGYGSYWLTYSIAIVIGALLPECIAEVSTRYKSPAAERRMWSRQWELHHCSIVYAVVKTRGGVLPRRQSLRSLFLGLGLAVVAQAWTGHCAIVPWHRRPLRRTQAPPGPFEIFWRVCYGEKFYYRCGPLPTPLVVMKRSE